MNEQLKAEKWVFVEGATRYAISNFGRVKGVNDNYLKTFFPPDRYPKVSLTLHDGSIKTFTVHRLVALHFLLKDKERTHVNHIDGNKENNHVENLEWCNPAENMQHASANNLLNIVTKSVKNSKGEVFQTVRLASKAYSVSEACIRTWARAEHKTFDGLTWKYI